MALFATYVPFFYGDCITSCALCPTSSVKLQPLISCQVRGVHKDYSIMRESVWRTRVINCECIMSLGPVSLKATREEVVSSPDPALSLGPRLGGRRCLCVL